MAADDLSTNRLTELHAFLASMFRMAAVRGRRARPSFDMVAVGNSAGKVT
jgi:hypothetical protein